MLIFTSVLGLFRYIVLVEINVENPALHTYVIGKGSSIFKKIIVNIDL